MALFPKTKPYDGPRLNNLKDFPDYDFLKETDEVVSWRCRRPRIIKGTPNAQGTGRHFSLWCPRINTYSIVTTGKLRKACDGLHHYSKRTTSRRHVKAAPKHERLHNLVDFPDYDFIMETGVVVSYRRTSAVELSGWIRNGERSRSFKMWCPKKGRFISVTQGRLAMAAHYGVSYFRLPQDVWCKWHEGKKPSVHHAFEGVKRLDVKPAPTDVVMEEMRRAERELQLLRLGYMGDLTPLSDYLYSERQRWIDAVDPSGYLRKKLTEADVLEIASSIFDRILDNVAHRKRIHTGVDRYVLRSLSQTLGREKTRRRRKLDVEFSEWAERYRSKEEDEDEDF
jgi:hypothetical protein